MVDDTPTETWPESSGDELRDIPSPTADAPVAPAIERWVLRPLDRIELLLDGVALRGLCLLRRLGRRLAAGARRATFPRRRVRIRQRVARLRRADASWKWTVGAVWLGLAACLLLTTAALVAPIALTFHLLWLCADLAVFSRLAYAFAKLSAASEGADD